MTPFTVQLRKTQIPKTLTKFQISLGTQVIFQSGKFLVITIIVQGMWQAFRVTFFLKRKRVERDETFHKCGSRTQLSLTKHWIRQKLRQQASKLIVIFLNALELS